jgi:hypothetical protein
MRKHDRDLLGDDATTFDAFARREKDDVERERARVRRGGPRAPLLLLPLIGLGAGIGVAYVAQAAHLTQAGYEQSSLAAAQAQLRQTDLQLGDQIARLREPARIDAAARQLGLQPPTKWTYVAARPAPIAPARGADAPITSSSGPDNAVQHVVDALLGVWATGSGSAQAPSSGTASNGARDGAGTTGTVGTAQAAHP